MREQVILFEHELTAEIWADMARYGHTGLFGGHGGHPGVQSTLWDPRSNHTTYAREEIERLAREVKMLGEKDTGPLVTFLRPVWRSN